MRCVGDQQIEWLLVGSSAETIALLVVGGVLLLLAGINEVYTNRSPIIPPRLFRVNVFVNFMSIHILKAFFRQGLQRSSWYLIFCTQSHSLAVNTQIAPKCFECKLTVNIYQALTIYHFTFKSWAHRPQEQVSGKNIRYCAHARTMPLTYTILIECFRSLWEVLCSLRVLARSSLEQEAIGRSCGLRGRSWSLGGA